MKKILIFGNSGAGKSTLAGKLSDADGLSHLDLDTLAWKPCMPPERKPLNESAALILEFIESNTAWVIEGCYADLLEIAMPFSNQIIFLKLPIDACIDNARQRPWEPHKYPSKAAQDNNLAMLVDWISQYSDRNDTFSERAHTELYERYMGKKRIITQNE
ncbi:AAA family ATPase [Arenicella xantha]|uniref:Adenylate kinase family enzyme n=1 Tax=Arenicella xantha TaxID=644221 RepID=A0A395JHS0_9GAMM|nr:AAA family ATPase [Arenicella xantha]RBP47065.1 adenylate kinase family enzyme [Arenicella xantha]